MTTVLDRALFADPLAPAVPPPFDEGGRGNSGPGPSSERSDFIDDDDGELERKGWRRLLPLLLLVMLPTLLVAGFEYLIASDQYQSEARFIVRAPQSVPSGSSLGQMLGLASPTAPADAHGVSEYLVSHDAIDALGRQRLTDIFRRPEADLVTRLWFATPQPETLLNYYLGKVELSASSETGITTLRVRAFRPSDAKMLAQRLLELGEQRVNRLNQRMLDDGLAAASRQVKEAEAEIEASQVALTKFRQTNRDIDPERTGAAQIQVAATLEQQAAAARASFQAMAAKIPPTAPQYGAVARQVRALEAQVATERARLAGSGRSLATGLGEFEKLRVKQDLAAKRYQAASTSYQSAREQLLKQQLFIVSVVAPNLPGKALYPQRLMIVATVFFGLLLAFAIGWLILAGVREHAA
ncbi:capsule biosynthesis protein [Sphingomonas sp. H39-1-10]|uniref:capsule biosynthesis protein n=1 Tax=Sphingomonas pollutisoli TaxID=3030829 RepID=UPI0023B97548|nr:capsule biosynthesis protein [Sphingomonas pollutisoli]MDF0487750.1 capsule biosynthesis protein [Sphingomonas pollutisoli]